MIDYKMPNRTSLKGRKSTINKAFIDGVLPEIKPTQEEIMERFRVLGMENEQKCAYCGGLYETLDHLNNLVYKEKYTGYFSEPNNLVPCCNSCNSSKGGQRWRTWILGNAKNSPKTRGVLNLDEKVARLEEFERLFPAKTMDFSSVCPNDWNEYELLKKQINALLDKTADKTLAIKDKLQEAVNDRYK